MTATLILLANASIGFGSSVYAQSSVVVVAVVMSVVYGLRVNVDRCTSHLNRRRISVLNIGSTIWSSDVITLVSSRYPLIRSIVSVGGLSGNLGQSANSGLFAAILVMTVLVLFLLQVHEHEPTPFWLILGNPLDSLIVSLMSEIILIILSLLSVYFPHFMFSGMGWEKDSVFSLYQRRCPYWNELDSSLKSEVKFTLPLKFQE
jgi:hypothetical protein